MKLYIILIAVGIAFIIAGAVVYFISNKDSQLTNNKDLAQNVEVEKTVNTQTVVDSNELNQPSPKEIGNLFEDFVANIFKDNKLFTVLEWNQGQTSSEGVYAEQDKMPDFKISQNFNGRNLVYWIECKYRSNASDKDFIKINDYQLKRYKKIQRESHKKVLIAIGLGGKPNKPDSFFVVPVDSINKEFINIDKLSQYELTKPSTEFANYIDSYFINEIFKKSKKK